MTAKTSPYFDRAQSWALDTQRNTARSRGIAWTIAGAAAGVAVFEALALAFLTPLKTVQPVTLLVDRQTGYVQALDPLKPQRIAADDALTQSFLAQYVAAREGFDRATIRADYRRVALWSAGAARAGYLRRMPATNPDSPLNRYGPGQIVATEIKSVSKLAGNVALVRFDTQLMGADRMNATPQSWIAVVRYRYVDAPMSMSDRLVNPLGFQVTGYRRDAEFTRPGSASVDKPYPARIAPVALPLARPLPVLRAAANAEAKFAPREVPLSHLPMGSPLSPGPVTAINASPRP